MTRQRELTLLGYAGLIPFVAGAIGAWTFGDTSETIARAQLFYGAVIAAFMAGMGAGGLLVSEAPANRRLLPGQVATLLAWASLFFDWHGVPHGAAHLVVIGVLVFLLGEDLRAVAARGLPDWYAGLRIRLTAVACLALGAVAVRAYLG